MLICAPIAIGASASVQKPLVSPRDIAEVHGSRLLVRKSNHYVLLSFAFFFVALMRLFYLAYGWVALLCCCIAVALLLHLCWFALGFFFCVALHVCCFCFDAALRCVGFAVALLLRLMLLWGRVAVVPLLF